MKTGENKMGRTHRGHTGMAVVIYCIKIRLFCWLIIFVVDSFVSKGYQERMSLS